MKRSLAQWVDLNVWLLQYNLIFCFANTLSLQIGPITAQDVTAALLVCKASARLHEARYAQFNSDYGQAAT